MNAFPQPTAEEGSRAPHQRHDPTGPPRSVSRRTPVSGIDIDRLARGSELIVVTKNSTYHLTIVDPAARRVLIAGGAQFPVARMGSVEGAKRGPLTCVGHLQVGLSMELLAAGQPIVTSRVYSIAVEDPAACCWPVPAISRQR
jgi:hypothetical protein